MAANEKFTGLLHDLSARVKVEEQLREQAALVRLGEMAAVIAYEVKNPLAAVRGAIQVIGKRLPEGAREVTIVTDIVARLDALNQLLNTCCCSRGRRARSRPRLTCLRSWR